MQSLLTTTTCYRISLLVSSCITMLIDGPICEWMSAPVFPRHTYLDSPKAGFPTRPDHSINLTSNLGLLCNGVGISLAVMDHNIKCITWAPAHTSPTSSWNSVHNELSSCFLVPNTPMCHGNKIPPWTVACLGGVLTPPQLLIPESWIIPKAFSLARCLEPQEALIPAILYWQLCELQL